MCFVLGRGPPMGNVHVCVDRQRWLLSLSPSHSTLLREGLTDLAAYWSTQPACRSSPQVWKNFAFWNRVSWSPGWPKLTWNHPRILLQSWVQGYRLEPPYPARLTFWIITYYTVSTTIALIIIILVVLLWLIVPPQFSLASFAQIQVLFGGIVWRLVFWGQKRTNSDSMVSLF